MSIVKLTVAARSAIPKPPISPILGQHGLNPGQFCKDFNEKTAGYIKEVPIPVLLDVKKDRKYDMVLRYPTVSYFLCRCGNTYKGVNYVSLKQIYELSKKIGEFTLVNHPLDSIFLSIVGTLKTMDYRILKDIK